MSTIVAISSTDLWQTQQRDGSGIVYASPQNRLKACFRFLYNSMVLSSILAFTAPPY